MLFLFNLIRSNRALAEAALVAALVFAAIVGVGYFAHHERQIGRAEVQAKWDAERASLKAAVQAQQEKNLELQRAAEKRYVVQGEIRDHYITNTVIEVRHETANLAACVLTPAAVGMFNNAGRCASEDSAAACGADGKVPDAAPAQ